MAISNCSAWIKWPAESDYVNVLHAAGERLNRIFEALHGVFSTIASFSKTPSTANALSAIDLSMSSISVLRNVGDAYQLATGQLWARNGKTMPNYLLDTGLNLSCVAARGVGTTLWVNRITPLNPKTLQRAGTAAVVTGGIATALYVTASVRDCFLPISIDERIKGDRLHAAEKQRQLKSRTFEVLTSTCDMTSYSLGLAAASRSVPGLSIAASLFTMLSGLLGFVSGHFSYSKAQQGAL